MCIILNKQSNLMYAVNILYEIKWAIASEKWKKAIHCY